jgi:hypothetical protein
VEGVPPDAEEPPVPPVSAELALLPAATLPPVLATPPTAPVPAVAPPASKGAVPLERLHAPIDSAPAALAATTPERHQPG